jgi:hypothetical protein
MSKETNKVATTDKVANEVKQSMKTLSNTQPIVKALEGIDKSVVGTFRKELSASVLCSNRKEAFDVKEYQLHLKEQGLVVKDERVRLYANEDFTMSKSLFHRFVKAGEWVASDGESADGFIAYRDGMLALDEACRLDIDGFNAWMKDGKPEAAIRIEDAVEGGGEGEGDEEFSDEEMDGVAAQFVVSTDSVSGSIHFNEDGSVKGFYGNQQALVAMFEKVAQSLGIVAPVEVEA